MSVSPLVMAAFFIMGFAVTACILFLEWLRDGMRRLRSQPDHGEMILGNDMRGRTGEVIGRGQQPGMVTVFVNGERWRGRFADNGNPAETVVMGEKVKISGIDGLTLKLTKLPKRKPK